MRRGKPSQSMSLQLLDSKLLAQSLGSARFLKTVKCRHRNGYLVVKIFIKPDPGVSLRNYHRRLKSAFHLFFSDLLVLT